MASTADTFVNDFINIFVRRSFQGIDFLEYLKKQTSDRSADEAFIVDTTIVGPILGLLGFEPGNRMYNTSQKSGRPDFAPTIPLYGTCFIIEDKNTTLSLTLKLSDPDSHLSQLSNYVRAAALRYGWLTNGQKLLVYRYDDPKKPTKILDIDVKKIVEDWSSTPSVLKPKTEKDLNELYRLFHKDSFDSTRRLEGELAVDLETWEKQALPLGSAEQHEDVLVESLQELIADLQLNARQQLDTHLTEYADFLEATCYLDDNFSIVATDKFAKLRQTVMTEIQTSKVMLGLTDEEFASIEEKLVQLEQDSLRYKSPQHLQEAILIIINKARTRKYGEGTKAARPWENFKDMTPLQKALRNYNENVFAWHQKTAVLRQKSRQALSVHNDYEVWSSVINETMLGDLADEERRDEFALQAAYVVFIRLLLIRVCEDKGLFPSRFLSDGGVSHWQEDIKRYLFYANGNPYEPLLEMAYKNAQNIYAHFFTGRELFNWYVLDQRRCIMALHRLSRFNFASVDSDIIGTIYNTYVNREEKRNKGQYYTPKPIINYILDQVGYVSGAAILGTDKKLIDPAAGSGSFLVSAAKRLVEAYTVDGKVDEPVEVLNRIQGNLYGFDLNPFACYLAEVNLLIQVLDLVKMAYDAGQKPKLQRFHVYNADALTRPRGMYFYTQYNTLLAAENDEANQIKGRIKGTSYEKGFAFVVANPPYGASLSDEYKQMLRTDWQHVFYGQPDTYTFFLQLGVEMLAEKGKLGYITPNTYLMGNNTKTLRDNILNTTKVEEIVDLPQGIWSDATVDCVLIFALEENDESKRREQKVNINLLDTQDSLDKLTKKKWQETLEQEQESWLDDPNHEMNIRYDSLIQSIEKACLVKRGKEKVVLTLDDVTDSSQGIIPYKTKAEGEQNAYIKDEGQFPQDEPEWKPLLDGDSYVGRYELRWATSKPYLKYGKWLQRRRSAEFFDSPKLLLQAMRNRSLQRRLVATFDNSSFYNRHNFNNIISKQSQAYDLKYILALFNSALLNFWYASRFDNVNINPSYIRQLPIFPAKKDKQDEFVQLVDELLAIKQALNGLRRVGYEIKETKSGGRTIQVPYDLLFSELEADGTITSTLDLFDAKAAGYFSIPTRCDMTTSISSNVFISARHETSVVLKHNKLWFDVPEEMKRNFLLGILGRPQWQGETWDDIRKAIRIPNTDEQLTAFFDAEAEKIKHINDQLDRAQAIDQEIDIKVLDLYKIKKKRDRKRVLATVANDD